MKECGLVRSIFGLCRGKCVNCCADLVLAMQDKALREALQAAEQRLRALDVEDQDAEREQLALVEHILQKLDSEQTDVEAQPAEAAAPQPARGAAAGVPETQEAEKETQKPMALLGPP